MARVVYKKKAMKTLLRMPRPLADRFRQAFQQIADGTLEGLDIKPLHGTTACRLRIANYRAILDIVGEDPQVLVLDIGPRGDVYK